MYALAIATSNLPFRHEKEMVALRTAFLLSAFLCSFVMYWICRNLWRNDLSLSKALGLCILACSALGIVCSASGLWAEVHLGGGRFPFRWTTAFSGMTGGAFVLIAWSAMYFGVKQYQALEEEKGRLRAAEASARNAQLLALRYQLQPHFLFNTLNAISSLVVSHQPELATGMIARLADLLRSTLNDPNTHFLTLYEELAVLRDYLAIEKIRFGSRLKVSYHIAEEANVLILPRFLLQPIVENAIHHGVSQMLGGGVIGLRAEKTSEHLHIRIENDVNRMHPMVHAPSGLGLRNSRERLATIYGEAASLTVCSDAAVFAVDILIPSRHSQQEVLCLR